MILIRKIFSEDQRKSASSCALWRLLFWKGVVMKGLDEKISVTIKQLLDLSEALWGDNPKWPFFRKLLLKNLNELRRDLVLSNQSSKRKE